MKCFAAVSVALALLSSTSDAYRYIIEVPFGSTSWTAGTTANQITWTSDASLGPAPQATVLGLWLYNNATQEDIMAIATNITESDTSYSWSIPSNIATSSEYSIRIGDPTWSDETFFNYSGLFNITAAPVTTTSTPPATTTSQTTAVTTATKSSNSTNQDSHATERLTYTALLAIVPALFFSTIGALFV